MPREDEPSLICQSFQFNAKLYLAMGTRIKPTERYRTGSPQRDSADGNRGDSVAASALCIPESQNREHRIPSIIVCHYASSAAQRSRLCSIWPYEHLLKHISRIDRSESAARSSTGEPSQCCSDCCQNRHPSEDYPRHRGIRCSSSRNRACLFCIETASSSYVDPWACGDREDNSHPQDRRGSRA